MKIVLTCKYFSFCEADDGTTKPKPREGRPQPLEPTEHKCLVRVVLGNKKISTVVRTALIILHCLFYLFIMFFNAFK